MTPLDRACLWAGLDVVATAEDPRVGPRGDGIVFARNIKFRQLDALAEALDTNRLDFAKERGQVLPGIQTLYVYDAQLED